MEDINLEDRKKYMDFINKLFMKNGITATDIEIVFTIYSVMLIEDKEITKELFLANLEKNINTLLKRF
jgi:hypothetical protein